MKKLISLLIFLGNLHFYSFAALAQVDPTSSLLLKPGSAGSENSDANLDNGRYVVKPVAPTQAAKPIKRWASPTAPKVEKPDPTSAADGNSAAKQPNAAQASSAYANHPALENSANPVANSENKNFSEAVQAMILGGDSDSIGHYKDKLQPDDPRLNILSFSVAPSYLYIDSSSAYWFRRYHSGGPGISTSADIWMTPFLAIDIGYFTTLAADLNGDPTTSRTTLVDHRYTSVNFLFRKYFSLSKKSPSLTFGFGYNEYQMMVAQNEQNRIRLQEYGLDLSLRLAVPTGPSHAWAVSSEIIPKMKVTEQPTTSSAQSGGGPTAYALKFSIGEDFNLDRNNRVFWRLSHRAEKSIYTGNATAVDPATGATPAGVSVTTGATLLELGYSWGD